MLSEKSLTFFRQITSQLSSLQKEHDKLSDTCSKAQSDAQAKASKIETLETELKRTDRDKNKLQADLDKLAEENSKATKALEKKVETLEHKVFISKIFFLSLLNFGLTFF